MHFFHLSFPYYYPASQQKKNPISEWQGINSLLHFAFLSAHILPQKEDYNYVADNKNSHLTLAE